MNKMKQQEWVDEVMQSTAGMKQAVPGPLFFERVKSRLDAEKREANNYRLWVPRLAAAAVLLLTINAASVLYSIRTEKKDSESKVPVYKALTSEMGFESANNY